MIYLHLYKQIANGSLLSHLLANKRLAIDFNQWSVQDVGLPDGMCIDQEGKLWIAGLFSSKVHQFDPSTGKYRLVLQNVSFCCYLTSLEIVIFFFMLTVFVVPSICFQDYWDINYRTLCSNCQQFFSVVHCLRHFRPLL